MPPSKSAIYIYIYNSHFFLNKKIRFVLFFYHSLFRFYNGNASSIRAIMVANCLAPAPAESAEQHSQPSSSNMKEEKGNPPSHKDLLSSSSNSSQQQQEEPVVLHHASSRLQYESLTFRYNDFHKSLRTLVINTT